jgi:hypothetical protein
VHATRDVAGRAPEDRAAVAVVPVRAAVLGHPARGRRAQAVVRCAVAEIGRASCRESVY